MIQTRFDSFFFNHGISVTSVAGGESHVRPAQRGRRIQIEQLNRDIVMRKFILAVAALAASTSVQAAVTVSFQGGGSTLPFGAVVIEDFSSFMAGASIGTNAQVFSASANGLAARPNFGSMGNFGAVLGSPTDGSYLINFAPTSVFTFALGSLDTYNTLSLTLTDNSIITYIGGQIINDLSFPSGDQISGQTNGRVTYTQNGGPLIKSALFQSTENSFEFDDLAVGGAVPEPATWAMMLFGFGVVGSALRARRAARSAPSFS